MKASTPKHLFELSAYDLSDYIDCRIPEGIARDQVYRIVYWDVVSLKWGHVADIPTEWHNWIDKHLSFCDGERPDPSVGIASLMLMGWSEEDALNRIHMKEAK